MSRFKSLSDTLQWVIIWWWISIMTAILTAIISYCFNSRQQKKERNYLVEKEEFFKLQEKMEIVFKWLDWYRLQIVIAYKSMLANTYFESDFTEQKIKERFGNARELMSQYTYIYFKELYEDIKKIIEIHDEILEKYFKIIEEQRNRTDEESGFFADKIQLFLDEYGKLLDKFLEKLEDKRKFLK